jgi:hypothetical protein
MKWSNKSSKQVLQQRAVLVHVLPRTGQTSRPNRMVKLTDKRAGPKKGQTKGQRQRSNGPAQTVAQTAYQSNEPAQACGQSQGPATRTGRARGGLLPSLTRRMEPANQPPAGLVKPPTSHKPDWSTSQVGLVKLGGLLPSLTRRMGSTMESFSGEKTCFNRPTRMKSGRSNLYEVGLVKPV